MAVSTLEDLFHETLKDIYNGEKQIIKALPKMAKKTESPRLKKAFETHRAQSETQAERLERVFELMDKTPRGKTCEAIEGLLAEGDEVASDVEAGAVRDAGLIAAAQAVEHYEIARYGALAAWADQLGMKEAAKLLRQTLDEEKKTDELLNDIALGMVNQKAA